MWFSVSLLYESRHPSNPEKNWLFEEIVVLIESISSSTAKALAEELALSKEHSYLSVEGDLVAWRFVKILQVYEVNVDSIESGVEVFARYLKSDVILSLESTFDE